MPEMEEEKLPYKLTDILKKEEEIEHFAQPLESAYQELYFKRRLLFWAYLVILGGLFLFVSVAMGTFSTFSFLLCGLFSGLAFYNARSVKTAYPKSFYGFTNMRVFFTSPGHTTVLFAYFKDIRDVQIDGQSITIDNNEYAGDHSSKKLKRIYGVQNTDQFVELMDQKLLKYRV